MKVFGLTVGRNEEQRYLAPTLNHSLKILDGHFFYDDRSTDRTPQIAEELGCVVVQRPQGGASFLESEGRFRDAAWLAFEAAMGPMPGDWVLVIDCDEVLVAQFAMTPSDYWSVIREVISSAGDRVAVNLNMPEVFGFADDGCPLIRTDRLWGTGHAPRLFRYRPGGSYFVGNFGVPAVPSYVMNGAWGTTEALVLMHYGYANRVDHERKYERYNGQPGHSDAHVQSILAPDKILERWRWAYIETMRTWTQSTS